jgi:hypothetical protein
MILAKQFVPFTIPCKPTSPHVKVELLNENEEVIPFLNFSDTLGFTMVENRSYHEEGIETVIVICTGMFKEKKIEKYFFLQVESTRTLAKNLNELINRLKNI